jgi:hypothetical protein
MEGNEEKVEGRGGEDGRNILKISTFHEPSLLPSSSSISLCPKHTLREEFSLSDLHFCFLLLIGN